MNKKRISGAAAIVSISAILAACVTTPSGQPAGRDVPLGDYAQQGEEQIARDFAQMTGARFAPGGAMKTALADLERSKFTCSPAATSLSHGDPPSRVCRRVIAADGCTHTWQVHLYDDGKGVTARSRGLYDRICGEELLGGS